MPLVRKPSDPASSSKPAPASLTAGASDERWAAARAAADHADSVPALATALATETDSRVREAIFTSLARIATAASAEAVVPYLKSEDADLRTGALDALRTMPRAAAPHLPRLLSDPDADVRLLSCDLVRCLPDTEASRLLCDLLDREAEKNVCAAAIEVLAELGKPEALPFLERCAARFATDSFIAFSIAVGRERIGALPPKATRE
jgi:HEAT repeat protein